MVRTVSYDGLFGLDDEFVSVSHCSRNDPSTSTTRECITTARHRFNNMIRNTQCVIGDASTVKNGSAYLKHWMDWLEENADVRYGGIA